MRVEKGNKAQAATSAKPKRRFGPLKVVRLVFWLFVLAVLVIPVVAFARVPKRFNVLVVGSDQRSEERGRSDVLMVVSLTKSPENPMTVLTIPRDTRVEVPGFGMQKITHAYALGDASDDGKNLGNVTLTEQTVEQFLGITIDGTIEVTFSSFEDLVDRLGGVTTEAHGDLNGEEALDLVRDRNREGGDFARAEDQREIIIQIIRKARAEKKLQEVYDFLRDSTDTRIRMSNSSFALFAAYALVRRGGNLSFDGVHNDVVPGNGASIYTPEFEMDLYYWVPDERATGELVATWLS